MVDSTLKPRNFHVEISWKKELNPRHKSTLNPLSPHQNSCLGDGEVQCDCCGKGILEIKCTKNPNQNEDIVPDSHFDQIQHYLLCLGPDYKYADYVVWHKDGPTNKRVFPDPARQRQILEKCELYCRHVVLPELMAKYFSSLKNIYSTLSTSSVSNVPSLICYCQKPAQHPTAQCKGKFCTFVSFRLKCVSLKTIPKAWLCPECKPSSPSSYLRL